MAVTCFPDTTVLINFGYLNRLDLLQTLLPARMWCLTVSRECRASYAARQFATFPDVQALFGAPLIPDRGEYLSTQVLRNTLAKPTDKPDAHIGEAETIAIAQSRQVGTPIFVTDDVGATKLANREGLSTINTWMLIKTASRNSGIAFTEGEAWSAATLLRSHRRGWPKGVGRSKDDFVTWLRQP